MRKLISIPIEWYLSPPSKEKIPEGVFTLQVDAGYKGGITGISTIIRTKDYEYKPREYSARPKGPVHAELTAVKKGIQRIRTIKRPIDLVVIYTDSHYGYNFLIGDWSYQRYYIRNVMEDITSLLDGSEIEVEFVNIKSKHNKRVDRRSKKKRMAEESKKEKQISERIMKVERTMVRGREIDIIEKNGKYHATSSKNSEREYLVSLDPLYCYCQWWQNKWENKSADAIYGRALPCKHMCALAEYLKKDIFELFKKQIESVD